MTALGPTDAPRRTAGPEVAPGARTGRWPLVVVATVAVLARGWGRATSEDLFVDELTYSRLSTSMQSFSLPSLWGRDFFLHPPLAFALYGSAFEALGVGGSTYDHVWVARWFNVPLAAGIAVLVFTMGERLADRRVALAGALLVTLDPFVLRVDGRVLLETPTLLLVLAAWAVIVSGLHRRPAPLSGCRLAAAGLLCGLAVLTKAPAALVTVLPVAFAMAWRGTLRPRDGGRILAWSAAPYAAWVVVVVAAGQWSTFADQQWTGILREAGVKQITGFNQPHAPSLASKLIDALGRFGPSYVLLAVAGLAALVCLFSDRADRRFVGLGALAAASVGAFSFLFGTLEEQQGYFVVLPGIVAAMPAYLELRDRFAGRVGVPRFVAAVPAIVAVLLVVNVGLAVESRTVHDSSYRAVHAWLDDHLESTQKVAVDSATSQQAWWDDPQFQVARSVDEWRTGGFAFVLTHSKLVDEGYGWVRPDMFAWLQAHAEPVFVYDGPTLGTTTVWRLP